MVQNNRMKIRNLLTFAAIAACCGGNLLAQSMKTTNSSGQIVTVTALTDRIIQVTTAPDGMEINPSPLVVLDNLSATGSTASTTGPYQFMTLGGSETDVPIAVMLANGSGTVTIADGPNNFLVGNSVCCDDTTTKGYAKLYTSGGDYFGAGERAHAINLAGDTLLMYNRPNYGYSAGDPRNNLMNISMPLIVSSKGFAILFDDYAAAELILSDPIEYFTESTAPLSYYYISGVTSIEQTIRELSKLTGRQPMPPLWTLGYITSKYGYRSQDETIGVVDTLKKHGYPLDGLVLDLYWYGREEDMGRLDWDSANWPRPKEMLDKLKDLNVNTVAISQPYVLKNGRGIDNYTELAANGLLLNDSTGQTQPVEIWVGTGGMFDMSNPATRRWLSNRYKTILLDNGITGLWGDLGEPEKHPETALHNNNLPTRLYHNLYGNDWSRLAFETMKEARPDERPMAMMRGGTIGLQRYGVFPWSGDVARSWAGMQAQPTIMMHSGLSGLGYMSHDVGGFAVDPASPSDSEMYLRWMQLGLFSPVLRTHAQSMAEPYNYPEIEPQLLDLIKTRYKWLPYNYTIAYENAAYGLPLVRPINFHDNSVDAVNDQYLWGRDIMVAPVMTPETTERQVIVPPGKWLDFYNPTVSYHGGDTITLPAPVDIIPLLVREGAFIPIADKPMQSTADYDPSSLTVNFFPTSDTTETYFSMYDDDHHSPDAIESGKYSILTFHNSTTRDKIEINIERTGSYPGMKPQTDITLLLHRLELLKNTKATVNGKKTKIFLTPDGTPAIKFKMTDKVDIEIAPFSLIDFN